MTKRHFEWAAMQCREAGLILKTMQNTAPGTKAIAEIARQTVIDAYVDLFKEFAPRFNETVFRAACEAF